MDFHCRLAELQGGSSLTFKRVNMKMTEHSLKQFGSLRYESKASNTKENSK